MLQILGVMLLYLFALIIAGGIIATLLKKVSYFGLFKDYDIYDEEDEEFY